MVFPLFLLSYFSFPSFLVSHLSLSSPSLPRPRLIPPPFSPIRSLDSQLGLDVRVKRTKSHRALLDKSMKNATKAIAPQLRKKLDVVLNKAFLVLRSIKHSGVIAGRIVHHELLEVCVQCALPQRADGILRDMHRFGARPGRTAFQTVLRGFRNCGDHTRALLTIKYMQSLRVPYFPLVYTILCEVAIKSNELASTGMELLGQMKADGQFPQCHDAVCVIVRGYGKMQDLEMARMVSKEIDVSLHGEEQRRAEKRFKDPKIAPFIDLLSSPFSLSAPSLSLAHLLPALPLSRFPTLRYHPPASPFSKRACSART